MKLKTLKDITFDETHFLIEQTIDKDWLGADELRKNAVSKIDLKQEAIKWIKKIRSMKYGEHFCLNCMKIYGGGNNGKQYCCRGEDGELHFLEQQTGSSIGAVSILMKINNITEEDLK